MIKKAQGFYEKFDRKDGSRTTTYCAGCGHGIIQKLIAEQMAELGLGDRAVFVSPVGCAAFSYYYFNCGHIGGPHGRASAVATGVTRVLPGRVVIAYQGNGDLGAIGFNHAFQAANRGEKFAVFFINNSVYAMTGGQMAPTTLPGQKTTTSPYGRDVAKTGSPLKACEVFNQLDAPVYIERVSVADTKRIMQAKKAVHKALEIQRDGKGYAFVEFLSPCPTNWRMDAVKAAEFVTNEMEKVFPLGCLRDRSEAIVPAVQSIEIKTMEDLFGGGEGSPDPVPTPSVAEKSFKFSGSGGQGVLSLGLVIAHAAEKATRYVTWFPSYGPEQRGGSASSSVVVSGTEIGSPAVDHPNVLVTMNRPAFERFAGTVAPEGLILHEASVPVMMNTRIPVRLLAFPAMKIAADNGVPKAANTAMLGALLALNVLPLPEEVVLEALDESFAERPQLVENSRKVLLAAKAWAKANIK